MYSRFYFGTASIAAVAFRFVNLLLFRCKQLCHRWLWRCRSPAYVADLRSGGKHHRRADVRAVGELSVRHRESKGETLALRPIRGALYRAYIDAKRRDRGQTEEEENGSEFLCADRVEEPMPVAR
jgi:hypothetical protein